MSTTVQDIQKEFLTAVRKGQDTVIDAIKTCVDSVQAVTPKLPAVRVPLAGHLPSPQRVVADVYDFAATLLAGQRKFAEGMVTAVAPLLPGSEAKATDSETTGDS
jgi:hypothetical protein